MKIPESDRTLLIRSDFSDEAAWQRIIEAVSVPSPQGFLANLQLLSDPSFERADAEALAQEADSDTEHVLLVVADKRTMSDIEMPLLCIDPIPPRAQFRCIPAELWGVENNVSLANMDFGEFAAAVEADGVFRGFRD